MSLPPFASSRPLSLGVELELQIVNTSDYDLSPQAADLLRVLGTRRLPGEVKPEMTRSMIELSTNICQDHEDALAQLRELRDALVGAARRLELGLCGGGTHPFQQWKRQRIYDAPRFHHLSGLYGYLAQQFTIFGQHVHIGCPSGDAGLQLLHGLSRFIPHVIALAASSPFVQGADTGFDSARLNSVFAFPLSGRAPFVETWDDFGVYFGKMTRTGVVESMKDFYWDIRPKPEYGTVEVRVLDTPLTVEKAAALAAYLQCLARWLTLEQPLRCSEDDYLPYTYNRFQACRFGVHGDYVDPGSGERQPLRDAILQSFDRIEPHAIALRAEGAIRLLRRELLADGNDAGWLRQRQAEDPLLNELVRQQTLRWAEG